MVWVSDGVPICLIINVSQISGSVQAQQSHQRPPHSILFSYSLFDTQQTFFFLLTSDIGKYWIFLFTLWTTIFCACQSAQNLPSQGGAHKEEPFGMHIIKKEQDYGLGCQLSHSGTVSVLQSTYPYSDVHC